MTPVIPDLWPKGLGESAITPPIAILRQQGIALGQRTANLVYGEVKTQSFPEHGAFTHVLWVVAPFLGYRTPVLVAHHKIDLYPVQVGPRKPTVTPNFYAADNPTQATTPDEFMTAIKDILGSAENVKLLRSLIAQSEEPAPAHAG